MNQEQKKVIVDEIHRWRDSKLLPAEYCDFLLNLYMEGESFSAEQQKESSGKPSKRKSVQSGKSGSRGSFPIGRLLLIFGTLLLLLIFAFNFTSFPQPMQIIAPLLVTLLCYILGWRLGRERPLVRVSWLLAGALLLFMSGFFYLSTNGLLADKQSLLNTMGLICFVWLLSGGIGRSRILAGMGWGGLLLVLANLLEYSVNIAGKSYGVQHFYWLIPALISLFLAYLLGRGRVYIAPVFLVGSLLLLFAPELMMLTYGSAIDFLIQAIVFLKLALLISVGIVFRADLKNWMRALSV